MERDSQDARRSRPLSVQMMGERFPALRGHEGAPERNGDSDPAPTASSQEDPRDPVFIMRENGEILFANCPLGNRSEDEVIGSAIFDWVHAEQHSALAESISRAFETGLAQRHELAGLQHQNGDAWYDCRITPNVREGKVVSATLVAHDITQYKRSLQNLETSNRDLKRLLEERTADLSRASQTIAEEAQSREEREREWIRFRTLMDQAGEAIFVTDPKTELVIDVNETAARWLGRPREGVIGKKLHELRLEFPVQPPVEMELEFTETRDTRRPLHLQGRHRRRDGTSFPVEVAVAHHLIGSESCVLAVARDTKSRVEVELQLRQSEERFTRLFEQCWDAIYLTARDGRIESINSGAVELFGYEKGEFVGLDARRLFARPMDIKRFQVQMNALGAVGDLEVQLLTADGTPFEALLSATRRPTEDGDIKGYQVIVRPLTLPAIEEQEEGETQGEIAASSTEDSARSQASEVRLRGTVVVADGGVELAMADDALRAAGMRVLTATSTESALELIRSHGESIDAAIFDADEVGERLRGVLEEVRRNGPETAIVLITETDPVMVAEGVADLGVRSILKKPVHPLALIQKIRDV
jgi:PAS domain S-box-containing protein